MLWEERLCPVDHAGLSFLTEAEEFTHIQVGRLTVRNNTKEKRIFIVHSPHSNAELCSPAEEFLFGESSMQLSSPVKGLASIATCLISSEDGELG